MSADAWSTCPRCLARQDVGYKVNEFREDYEIYGAEDGVLKINYRGECQRCGLLFELKLEHPIPGLDEPEINKPKPDKARESTWGHVPAGWFVRTPKGKWLEITSTHLALGRQYVGMAIGDSRRSYTRDPAGKVTACPGTRWVELGSALDALSHPQILDDPPWEDGS